MQCLRSCCAYLFVLGISFLLCINVVAANADDSSDNSHLTLLENMSHDDNSCIYFIDGWTYDTCVGIYPSENTYKALYFDDYFVDDYLGGDSRVWGKFQTFNEDNLRFIIVADSDEFLFSFNYDTITRTSKPLFYDFLNLVVHTMPRSLGGDPHKGNSIPVKKENRLKKLLNIDLSSDSDSEFSNSEYTLIREINLIFPVLGDKIHHLWNDVDLLHVHCGEGNLYGYYECDADLHLQLNFENTFGTVKSLGDVIIPFLTLVFTKHMGNINFNVGEIHKISIDRLYGSLIVVGGEGNIEKKFTLQDVDDYEPLLQGLTDIGVPESEVDFFTVIRDDIGHVVTVKNLLGKLTILGFDDGLIINSTDSRGELAVKANNAFENFKIVSTNDKKDSVLKFGLNDIFALSYRSTKTNFADNSVVTISYNSVEKDAITYTFLHTQGAIIFTPMDYLSVVTLNSHYGNIDIAMQAQQLMTLSLVNARAGVLVKILSEFTTLDADFFKFDPDSGAADSAFLSGTIVSSFRDNEVWNLSINMIEGRGGNIEISPNNVYTTAKFVNYEGNISFLLSDISVLEYDISFLDLSLTQIVGRVTASLPSKWRIELLFEDELEKNIRDNDDDSRISRILYSEDYLGIYTYDAIPVTTILSEVLPYSVSLHLYGYSNTASVLFPVGSRVKVKIDSDFSGIVRLQEQFVPGGNLSAQSGLGLSMSSADVSDVSFNLNASLKSRTVLLRDNDQLTYEFKKLNNALHFGSLKSETGNKPILSFSKEDQVLNLGLQVVIEHVDFEVGGDSEGIVFNLNGDIENYLSIVGGNVTLSSLSKIAVKQKDGDFVVDDTIVLILVSEGSIIVQNEVYNRIAYFVDSDSLGYELTVDDLRRKLDLRIKNKEYVEEALGGDNSDNDDVIVAKDPVGKSGEERVGTSDASDVSDVFIPDNIDTGSSSLPAMRENERSSNERRVALSSDPRENAHCQDIKECYLFVSYEEWFYGKPKYEGYASLSSMEKFFRQYSDTYVDVFKRAYSKVMKYKNINPVNARYESASIMTSALFPNITFLHNVENTSDMFFLFVSGQDFFRKRPVISEIYTKDKDTKDNKDTTNTEDDSSNMGLYSSNVLDLFVIRYDRLVVGWSIVSEYPITGAGGIGFQPGILNEVLFSDPNQGIFPTKDFFVINTIHRVFFGDFIYGCLGLYFTKSSARYVVSKDKFLPLQNHHSSIYSGVFSLSLGIDRDIWNVMIMWGVMFDFYYGGRQIGFPGIGKLLLHDSDGKNRAIGMDYYFEPANLLSSSGEAYRMFARIDGRLDFLFWEYSGLSISGSVSVMKTKIPEMRERETKDLSTDFSDSGIYSGLFAHVIANSRRYDFAVNIAVDPVIFVPTNLIKVEISVPSVMFHYNLGKTSVPVKWDLLNAADDFHVYPFSMNQPSARHRMYLGVGSKIKVVGNFFEVELHYNHLATGNRFMYVLSLDIAFKF